MKKLLVSSLLCLAVLFGTAISGQCADVTLNLKATWTPNAEPDLSGYFFWGAQPRTAEPYKGYDYATSTWLALDIRGSKIDKALSTINFVSQPVSDSPPTGSMYFSLEAVDTNNNISAKSAGALYSFNLDSTAPAVPVGLTITKQ